MLTDGRVVKATSFEVAGERVRIGLDGSGTLTLSLLRVERVVDDEVVPAGEPEPPAPISPLALAFSPAPEIASLPFAEEIAAAGERHDLNPRLLLAVAQAESALAPRAVSPKGARGLMQLMPATGLRLGLQPAELFDPGKNVDAGARYLRSLVDRYDGALHLALAAYNAGEGAVDRYRGVPPYKETRRYVRRVYELFGVPAGSPR